MVELASSFDRGVEGHVMSLLGLPLLAGVILLAIAVTITCVWASGRLRGRGIRQVAQRTLLILACQVCALVAVAVAINQQYEFYTTWDDLVGSSNSVGTVTQLTPPEPGSGLGAQAASGVRFRPDGVDGVQVATYTGPRSGIRTQVYVWLPPQYNQAAYAGKRFPVIELLPGFPGSVRNWFTQLNVTELLRQDMASGASQPTILVAPTMQVEPGLDTDCTNIPGGPQVETWAAEDVQHLIKADFRARTDRFGWAAMGYSEGGFCAAKLAVQHPRNFGSAVSLSGYFTPSAKAVTRSPSLFKANNLLRVLRTDHPAASLLVMGTRQDGDTALDVTRLRAVAHAPTEVFSAILPTGGHNFGVWNSMLPQAIKWMSSELRHPR
jgi:S-formylglutathione hydrolase FrmB